MEEHGTWLHFLYSWGLMPEAIPEMVAVTFFVVLILSVTAIISSKILVTKNPGRYQTALELIVTGLDSFAKGIVGDATAKTATPIIGTVFIFVFVLNVFGLIPGFISPTANINTTISLAIFAFIIVQYYGIRKLGLKYFMHFIGEPLWLAPLMLPIHIIGELAKPLSLAIRLFGNIFGEDMVISVLILIVITLLGKCLIPIQLPITLFAVFTSLIQAFVFSMLFSIYIALAIAGHEEEEH